MMISKEKNPLVSKVFIKKFGVVRVKIRAMLYAPHGHTKQELTVHMSLKYYKQLNASGARRRGGGW